MSNNKKIITQKDLARSLGNKTPVQVVTSMLTKKHGKYRLNGSKAEKKIARSACQHHIVDKKGNIKITYAIDWDSTLKLWYDDEEAFNNKTLVKFPEKSIFRVKYNKSTANYENKSFMEFQVNRNIKTRLKQKIKNNEIDAFNL